VYTWLLITLFGPANEAETLRSFAAAVNPSGPGWRGYRDGADPPVWPALLRVAGGAVVVYGALYGIGQLVVGSAAVGCGWLALAGIVLFLVVRGQTPSQAASSS
jgi:SSS family solute:Na+ symporter